MKGAVKRLYSVITTFVFVYLVYVISIFLFKAGLDGASRDFAFIKIS